MGRAGMHLPHNEGDELMLAKTTITTEITNEVGEHITTVSTTMQRDIGGNPIFMRRELRPRITELQPDGTPINGTLLSRHFAALEVGIAPRV